MKKSLIPLFLFFTAAASFANIAVPQQPPSPAGDIVGFAEGLAVLKIEREDLLLDLTGRQQAFSKARYVIFNPSDGSLNTAIYFITPFKADVTVAVDQSRPATMLEKLTRDRVPWHISSGDYEWWREGMEVEAVRFNVEFKAGKRTHIEVTFRLPAGYDNTLRDTGIYPSQAAHALNWGKDEDRVAWYIYSLESAATFKGGIEAFHLSILTPAGAELKTNFTIPLTGSEEGISVYEHSFAGFPAPSIEAKVITRSGYNIFGGTFGLLGLSTDFTVYTEFLMQATADLYFYNHQLSAGVEGNPFGTAFRLPLLYTFYLGGRSNAFYALLLPNACFSLGGLFDLSPSARTGLRIAAALIFMGLKLEMAYDFYPFDPAAGFIWRMTFLYKFSI